MSLHQVCYDIGSDKTRRKMVKLLEGYGNRVQKSVFICALKNGELDRLEAEVLKLLGPGDSVLMVCIEARSPMRILGTPIVIPDPDAVVVL